MNANKHPMNLDKSKELWPTSGIEKVANCPVCGNDKSHEVYGDLADMTFFCAPGKWPFFVCTNCHSGYLSVRPTRETIGQAYGNYYTHQSSRQDAGAINKKSLLRQKARNLLDLYISDRFGGSSSSIKHIALIRLILWPYKGKIEREYRHLPKCEEASMRLLDVGCGNGSFLLKISKFGWQSEGVDFDQKAVEAARLNGIDVYLGGIEVYSDQREIFDVITASHVIEHLHDPSDFIQCCYRLLKPSGELWLETPNISSESHAIFRRNWRGLEAPRHLVLFNRKSLRFLLSKFGFERVQNISCPSPSRGMHRASYAIAEGVSEKYKANNLGYFQKILLLRAFIASMINKKRTEFVTLKANKSSK